MRWRVPLYEVWCSRGWGLVAGPRFRYLGDARRYVEAHRRFASLAIRNPDGQWEYVAARRRHYSSRIVQERKP